MCIQSGTLLASSQKKITQDCDLIGGQKRSSVNIMIRERAGATQSPRDGPKMRFFS